MRSVFVIGPDKKVKAMLTYPMSTGRNFDEVLRLLDSCQLTAKHKVATPVNWKQGQDVIIVPAVSDDEAKKTYPAGWKIAEAVSAHRSPAEVARTRRIGRWRLVTSHRPAAGGQPAKMASGIRADTT